MKPLRVSIPHPGFDHWLSALTSFIQKLVLDIRKFS